MIIINNKKEYIKELRTSNELDGRKILVKRSNKTQLNFVCNAKDCLFVHNTTIIDGSPIMKDSKSHTCEKINVFKQKGLLKLNSLCVPKNMDEINILKETILKSNPETDFIIEVGANNEFCRCFVSFNSWKNCFKYFYAINTSGWDVFKDQF